MLAYVQKHLRWRVLWKNIYVGVFCGKTSTLAFFQTHLLGYKYDQYGNNKEIKNNQLLNKHVDIAENFGTLFIQYVSFK